MSESLFRVLKYLEAHSVHYTLERTRPDSVRVNAAFFGERTEIDVRDDGTIEVARFFGDEEVTRGFALIESIVAERCDPVEAPRTGR